MKFKQALIPTVKDAPQDADCLSHQLLVRAGLARKLASGTYMYLPLGQKSLLKIQSIIREEMNRAGAQEVLLPAIHPAELWKETGRFEILGEDMIHFKDRHGRENVLGPTHEEIITELARREITTYRQLPMTLYQIQTKFRDEMRPRSGIIRSREFIMKDAYSFHADEASLDETYERMKAAYCRVFERVGLKYYIVKADPGAMGGGESHEFVLFSPMGEDTVVQYGESRHVVASDMAERVLTGLKPDLNRVGRITEVYTPQEKSVESVSRLLKKTPRDLVKTMIYASQDAGASRFIGVLVRGDHEVSEFKVKKALGEAVRLATAGEIEALGSAFGYSGPLGSLRLETLWVDEDVLGMKDFVTGANRKDYHLTGVEIKDIYESALGARIRVGDFRRAVEGDKGIWEGRTVELKIQNAIELGHIFKLKLRYSKPMKAHFTNDKGESLPMVMGCYGIGVNRILAASLEQASSPKAVLWSSRNVCPYEVELIALGADNPELEAFAESFYQSGLQKGWDILYDDRSVSAGVKFNDADLLGCPLTVIIGQKTFKDQKAEFLNRQTQERKLVSLKDIEREVENALDSLS